MRTLCVVYASVGDVELVTHPPYLVNEVLAKLYSLISCSNRGRSFAAIQVIVEVNLVNSHLLDDRSHYLDVSTEPRSRIRSLGSSLHLS